MVQYSHKPALIEQADKWAEEWRKTWVPMATDLWFQTFFKINPSDKKTRSPRKGDLVDWDNERGTIAWVSDDDVNVYFGHKLESFDKSEFRGNYDTPRGRTVWKL